VSKQLISSARLLQEFELAKLRQDRQLEGIEKGLGTLREVASAMGEALEHQDVLVDAITEKVSASAICCSAGCNPLCRKLMSNVCQV